MVSDITDATDTARLADMTLPAATWAEKNGTVTNSDRTIARHWARRDWWHIAGLALRMG